MSHRLFFCGILPYEELDHEQTGNKKCLYVEISRANSRPYLLWHLLYT